MAVRHRFENAAPAAFDCAGRIRTCDLRFRKPLLYPLSYRRSRQYPTPRRDSALGLPWFRRA